MEGIESVFTWMKKENTSFIDIKIYKNYTVLFFMFQTPSLQARRNDRFLGICGKLRPQNSGNP